MKIQKSYTRCRCRFGDVFEWFGRYNGEQGTEWPRQYYIPPPGIAREFCQKLFLLRSCQRSVFWYEAMMCNGHAELTFAEDLEVMIPG